MSIVKEFNDYRLKMNDRILGADNKVIKRFWSLDHQTYDDGALDKKTKELLGLVASMVLRCDDCSGTSSSQCRPWRSRRRSFVSWTGRPRRSTLWRQT